MLATKVVCSLRRDGQDLHDLKVLNPMYSEIMSSIDLHDSIIDLFTAGT